MTTSLQNIDEQEPRSPLDPFPPRGYQKLASLMGNYHETAIFRRFDSLSMLNVLSLQAELLALQDELGDICFEDESSDDPAANAFAVNFFALRESEGGINDEQYQILIKIREKLREYSQLFPADGKGYKTLT